MDSATKLLSLLQIFYMLKQDWTHKPKSLSATQRISNIPHQTVHDLCTLLDARSSDWKRLAARFDLATSLFTKDRLLTPTKLLLDVLDVSPDNNSLLNSANSIQD